MSRLEDLQPACSVSGLLPDCNVTVENVKWFGSDALEVIYRDSNGRLGNQVLYRHQENQLDIVAAGRAWSLDGLGADFRLVSEAQRIHLAHLFDPLLAVHTSLVEPLPHQITAVYEAMLPRQPLRFLLADDPGAGKTIMAGLLIKELIARGDVQRCLIVCPGNLAEQWQDELGRRFNLTFKIMTNEGLEQSGSNNWFLENNLVIARLDKLSRDEETQAKLNTPDARWDLVVCDEAHKLSASYFNGEVSYTKRYKLGQALSSLTRHFLLMTATPHNGKEADFQLFLALLDTDRFEGKFRSGVPSTDASDLMRRMVKENLLKFDGTPLFPERFAHTVPYKLSRLEDQLYEAVTEYVRTEFNKAKKLVNQGKGGTVGFALTILQRRLASSPEAILQSLKRRRARLEAWLQEVESLQRTNAQVPVLHGAAPLEDYEEEDLEDTPENELEAQETAIFDKATASQTITELKSELATLKRLEDLAVAVRRSGEDTKWREVSGLLNFLFSVGASAEPIPASLGLTGKNAPTRTPHQKLVIFTEHRDTLSYLKDRISTLFGTTNALVEIHGSMDRKERAKAQESFLYNPEVKILLATDAAGEGINLQRAHLMINYDLPWNPNRIEQRFGRVHRIGQTEICHLWNLVAGDTREGQVYQTLLEKLNECRNALGGQVFDVLGKVEFDGRALKDLLLDAILYGALPENQAKLTQVVAGALDQDNLRKLLAEHALVHDSMDASRVQAIRADMERADARRLQPHYIESFFMEAFKQLNGTIAERESRRYEITNVPPRLRARDRFLGMGEVVLSKYQRVVFEKTLIEVQNQPLAAFLAPGHPLLRSTIDLVLERHRDLLRRGTILIDERDPGDKPHMVFYLEHALQDATRTRNNEQRVISKQLLYVDINQDGETKHLHYAPYLDYRPLKADDPEVKTILARQECNWLKADLEKVAASYAISKVVPEHYQEVNSRKQELLAKTESAVKERLSKEIQYWDHRSQELHLQEEAGKPNARLNSNEAQKRADLLQARLETRLDEIKREKQISALPPIVLGGFLVVPAGLLAKLNPSGCTPVLSETMDTQAAGARAREIIMAKERELGFDPVDKETEKLGYDIESKIPGTGKLRFIEVKGRVSGAATITVTRNEILYSLNKPEDFILGIVEFTENGHNIHYIRQPFHKEPDFGVTSVNYNFAELIARANKPA